MIVKRKVSRSVYLSAIKYKTLVNLLRRKTRLNLEFFYVFIPPPPPTNTPGFLSTKPRRVAEVKRHLFSSGTTQNDPPRPHPTPFPCLCLGHRVSWVPFSEAQSSCCSAEMARFKYRLSEYRRFQQGSATKNWLDKQDLGELDASFKGIA